MRPGTDAAEGKKTPRADTRLLADLCHGCGICPYAEKQPQSLFGRIMRWHRTWCPAWAAHTTVYGRKSLS